MKAPDSLEGHTYRERYSFRNRITNHDANEILAQVDERVVDARRVTGDATVRGAVLDLKRIILRDLAYRDHAFRIRS